MKDQIEQDHKIIAWFAHNSVVANVLLFAILGFGIWTALTVRKEAFPSFDAKSVNIEVPFRGGTPEDVERGVVLKIEESLENVDGIEHINSTSRESGATIVVQAYEDYNLSKLLDDVKIKVDAIPTLPEQAEKPIISERKRENSVIWVEVHGDAREDVLKETARELRDDLLLQDSISTVNTSGARDYEISIEVSEDKLRSYGLTFEEVSQAVSANSIDLSGGVIRSNRGDISLRTRSQAYNTNDFASIPLRTTSEGTRIYLRDVATVRDGFVDQEYLSDFEGSPTVSLNIVNEGSDDILKARRQADEVVQHYLDAGKLPEGVELTLWSDESKVIRARLMLLAKNGILGVLLVILSLTLFLNLRLAFWVSLGIPISLAGAVILFPLPGVDISINVLTSFAFILVLGIVVDDAIVIGESVFAEKEKQSDCTTGNAPFHATVRGVSRVIVPAVFGVLTTIAAFYPLTQVTGRMGNVFGQIALGVIFCLIFSLIESKLILPAHLAHLDVHKKPRNPISRAWARFQGRISSSLKWFIKNIYQRCLQWLIPHRYSVTATFIAIFIVVAALLPSNRLRFVFFPDIQRDSASAILELEEGLPVSYLHEQARLIANAAHTTGREFESETGHNPFKHVQVHAKSNTLATIAVELTPSESRTIATNDIVNTWRKKVAGIAGAKSLTFSGKAGPPGGALDIQLQSDNLESLKAAAEKLKVELSSYNGVFDVQDTFSSGRPEIQVEVTPEGEAAGFAKRDLATNLRDAFYGREAQRVQRGRDEVKVMVRYPIEDRGSIDTMRDMRVRSADGTTIPFGIVAESTYGQGLSKIERYDGKRIVSVKGDVNKNVTSSDEVLSKLQKDYFPELLKQHPDINFNLSGEAEQRGKSMKSLIQGFGVSILLIYILLAIPLKSYAKPLFIMSVIPFGIIGALLGHFLVGIPVSILSIFGILALSGVVVNDSLVLVHRVDDLRSQYDNLEDTIYQAGGERFRAILLTSVTTFVGLAPLLTETEVQAQFLKPMAVSLGFGVLFATFITLILLPMQLLIARDIRRAFAHSAGSWKSLFQKNTTES